MLFTPCVARTARFPVPGEFRTTDQARATRLNQPDSLPAPINPKSEIRNPKFRQGGWAAFLIPNSSFLIPNSLPVHLEMILLRSVEPGAPCRGGFEQPSYLGRLEAAIRERLEKDRELRPWWLSTLGCQVHEDDAAA